MPEVPIPNRIKELREARGMSAAALAKLVKMSQPQISRLEGGQRRLKADQAVAIAGALGVKTHDLLLGDRKLEEEAEALQTNVSFVGEVPPIQKAVGPSDVPVFGRAEGGDDGFYEINLADGPLEYVERPSALANVKTVFAIMVYGTSMDPVWQPDDVVYVVPSRAVNPGDYVVVQLERGRGQQPAALLKRFIRKDDNEVVLEQHNPPMEVRIDRDDVKEMWRALHWRDLR